MYKVKYKVHLFITPDLFRKLVLHKPFDMKEIIFDPAELWEVGELKFDIIFTRQRCEMILKGKFEYALGNIKTMWELVNCTPDDKIKLIHLIDQTFVTKETA